ncbi:D-alanyl-D-alanine carboxypeptidase family protein [Paracoccus sp. p3-h83]|uniref:D-alanyl-D-alanine carboxypeptidase family protein n=1 Tax=Paracoccus sp. p3-h83 TaxID=3342805 RepID=UPI0035BB99BE
MSARITGIRKDVAWHVGMMVLMAVMIVAAPLAAMAAPFAAFVMDARSGKEVYATNADAKLHPASLTKMMTLYIAFEAIERGQVSLDSKFLVSSNAANQPPSRLGLKPGQRIELRYLIRAAAVKSANDAATVIAEGISGSVPEFSNRMNRTARALGMRNSHFMNPHGLTTDGHYSSARDMTILGRRLFYDFPQYYSIFSRRTADAGVARVSSTNTRFLDNYEGADGIKTGYTRAAGFNLTASAQRGSKRVVATVLGGQSTNQRNEVMGQLLDAGFGRAPMRADVNRPAPPAYLAEEAAPVATPRAQRVVVAPKAPVAQPQVSATAPAPRPTPGAVAQTALPTTAAAAPTQVARTSPRPTARPAIDRAVAAAIAEAEAAPVVAAADIAAAVAQASTAALPARSAASGASSPRPVAKPGNRKVAAAPPPEDEGEGDRTPADAVPTTPARKAGDTVILASASPAAPAPNPQRETVARSGGGSGNWSVSLGLFTSKAGAEKALLQTALAEAGTLQNARRDIRDTARGFEGRFHRLSRDDAWLTCKRLEARSAECRVISP